MKPTLPRRRAHLLPALAALVAAPLVLALSACAGPAAKPGPGIAATAATAAATRSDLLDRLRPLCGKAFAGRVVVDTPKSADDPFAGKPLVMHVRECSANEIRVPFHVGDDRSRTWVLRDDGTRFNLKHDHRHADGSADAMTLYGGDWRESPRAGRYEFPADDESKALFGKLGRAVSIPNVWAIEIDERRFVYELARPGRLFRVEFDLTQAVPAPAPPWGS
ncbi:hypothetical protein [Lysobacter antibioticus]|uniref:Lipoprotein n=1 Tax=Lysobacter antibioticus TaxID=84531 RepID=A0A0S2FFM4_LYSAN|nr:hypothetical protein [Lysobacter antibioticus]ALN82351.1 hypothetical protein LA76x_4240 [Lysobacter antibioticus]